MAGCLHQAGAEHDRLPRCRKGWARPLTHQAALRRSSAPVCGFPPKCKIERSAFFRLRHFHIQGEFVRVVRLETQRNFGII